MAQNDSLTSITIAEDTHRDSASMKTIAALTMVFLPATFVATFFSMGFFHFGVNDNVQLKVAPLWWLYLVVTIPLTVMVLVAWVWWLKLKSGTDTRLKRRNSGGGYELTTEHSLT
jgi:Mg2+ and Co2+ transporter CorA